MLQVGVWVLVVIETNKLLRLTLTSVILALTGFLSACLYDFLYQPSLSINVTIIRLQHCIQGPALGRSDQRRVEGSTHLVDLPFLSLSPVPANK